MAQRNQWGSRNPGWKGDKASDHAKRSRCVRMFKLGLCEDCGKPAKNRHHIDSNPGNNKPSNIAILCCGCHMKRDGRLKKLMASKPKIKPARPCVNCGKNYKPLRRGMCHACSEYLRRTGKKRPPVENWYKISVDERRAKPCKRCSRPAGHNGIVVRGYCQPCYQHIWYQKSSRLKRSMKRR